VILPFLETLYDGKERTMREVADLLAARFALSDPEQQELLPSGQQSIFGNRAALAKSHLKNAGLIENPVRGRVRISASRTKVLRQKPARGARHRRVKGAWHEDIAGPKAG
jgi:restriction system protein